MRTSLCAGTASDSANSELRHGTRSATTRADSIAAQERFGAAVDAFEALVAPRTGAHQRQFMGHPATGRAVSFGGVRIGRFEEGLLVERWGSSDQLGRLGQLGLALRQ